MGTVIVMDTFDPELYSLIFESAEALLNDSTLELFDLEVKYAWLVKNN